jgi:hypothetical protein
LLGYVQVNGIGSDAVVNRELWVRMTKFMKTGYPTPRTKLRNIRVDEPAK